MMLGYPSIPALFSLSQSGCRDSSSRLYDLAFHRLHGIAASLMRREIPGHTLPPTALVGELFLKLRSYRQPINSDEHFFRIAARAMRQVLVDHSRVRNPKKRLTDYQLVESLPAVFSASRATESVLSIRALMSALQRLDARAAQTIRLRYVEGFTLEEIARLQHREVWRVRDDLRFATKWLIDRYGA